MSRRYGITKGDTVMGMATQDGWRITDSLVGRKLDGAYPTEEEAQAEADRIEALWQKRQEGTGKVVEK